MVHPRNGRLTAFTLIEILTVIAIIGLLSAILFPVFSRARQMSLRAACMSNMRQIGLAISSYSQDYDEVLPLTSHRGWELVNGDINGIHNFNDPSAAGFAPNVLNGILPYTRTADIYTCPGTKKDRFATKLSCTNLVFNGCLIKRTAGDTVSVPGDFSMRKLSEIGRASEIVMFQEVSSNYPWLFLAPQYQNFATLDYLVNPANPTPTTMNRTHFEGGNRLYVDGHVKWKPYPGAPSYSTQGASDFGYSSTSAEKVNFN